MSNWCYSKVDESTVREFLYKLQGCKNDVYDADLVICAYVLGSCKSPKFDVENVSVESVFDRCYRLAIGDGSVWPILAMISAFERIDHHVRMVSLPRISICGESMYSYEDFERIVHKSGIEDEAAVKMDIPRATGLFPTFCWALYYELIIERDKVLDDIVRDLSLTDELEVLLRGLMLGSRYVFSLLSGRHIVSITKNTDGVSDKEYSYEMSDVVDEDLKERVSGTLKYYRKKLGRNMTNGLSDLELCYLCIDDMILCHSETNRTWANSVWRRKEKSIAPIIKSSDFVDTVTSELDAFDATLPSLFVKEASVMSKALFYIFKTSKEMLIPEKDDKGFFVKYTLGLRDIDAVGMMVDLNKLQQVINNTMYRFVNKLPMSNAKLIGTEGLSALYIYYRALHKKKRG